MSDLDVKPTSTGRDDGVALLAPALPPFIARSAGWLMVLIFFAAFGGAVWFKLPETVRCEFTLIPPAGTDPIQSPVEGRVVFVGVDEGTSVTSGQELFSIRSDKIQGWTTDLATAEQELQAVKERRSLRQQTYAAAVRLQRSTIQLYATQADYHRREITKRQELIEHMDRLGKKGLIPGLEASRDRVGLTQVEREEATSKRSLGLASAKLRTMEAELNEADAADDAAIQKLTVQIEALRGQVVDSAKGAIAIRAPFDGTVLSVARKRVGDVVEFGQELCQLARAGEKAVAQLTLPEKKMARVRAGQRVKLFFTAFPYQRFGTIGGTLRWASPASVDAGEQTERFVASVELDSSEIRVYGEPRPLQVGMKGEARVFVGSRTLLEYALEPIKALREEVSDPTQQSVRDDQSAEQ